MRMIDVARRLRAPRRLTMAAAGLSAALGLALPAAAQAATAGYTPPPAEWWMSEWSVPQQVWPLTEGAGVTVGVVDSGVQASLPDLSGVVLRGADLTGASGYGDRDFETTNDGHGSGVAEMIAGQGAGGPVGIAPKAKILPVHTGSGQGGTSSGSDSINADGIKYAVNHGAGVINLSLGNGVQSATTCGAAMQGAVAYALEHNVVVIASSGDLNLQSGPIEPASCAGVLSVGGIEPNGSLWKNSTREPYVSVAAPGDHIYIQGMDGRTGTNASGTSFSSPLVAGAAALIKSKYPSMPWYQVDQRIIDTAVGVRPVPNDGYGYGIMNVAKAVNASKFPVPASAPNPPYTRYLAWLKSTNGQIWAQANGVKVPGTGKSASGTAGSGSASSATAKPASGSPAALIIVAVVAVLAVLALVLALVVRSRSRRSPR